MVPAVNEAPAENVPIVPAKAFEFTDSRYGDAAMSPFFHNFCDDIKLAQILPREDDVRLPREDDVRLRRDDEATHSSGLVDDYRPWTSSSRAASIRMTPPLRLECDYEDCKCTVYRPSLFVPRSLASDEDWDELYIKLREKVCGITWRPISRQTGDGRYISLGTDLERADREMLDDVFTFLSEYRQIKILMVAAAEKARREDDPFNPDNWKDDAKEQVGEAFLLCACGHAEIWHYDERRAASRRHRQEEEEMRNETERIERRRIRGEVQDTMPYWEYTAAETSGQDARKSEIVEEPEVQIRIENGRLVVPGK